MAKLIKRENICVVYDTYEDKNGDEKKSWKTIGEILTFEGEYGESKMVKLYTMPGVKISAFEQKDRDEEEKPKEKKSGPPYESGKEAAEAGDTVNPADIPF